MPRQSKYSARLTVNPSTSHLLFNSACHTLFLIISLHIINTISVNYKYKILKLIAVNMHALYRRICRCSSPLQVQRAPHRALWRAGQVPRTQQSRPVQTQLLQVCTNLINNTNLCNNTGVCELSEIKEVDKFILFPAGIILKDGTIIIANHWFTSLAHFEWHQNVHKCQVVTCRVL